LLLNCIKSMVQSIQTLLFNRIILLGAVGYRFLLIYGLMLLEKEISLKTRFFVSIAFFNIVSVLGSGKKLYVF